MFIHRFYRIDDSIMLQLDVPYIVMVPGRSPADALLGIVHHADPSEVYQPYWVDMMYECTIDQCSKKR